MNIAFSRQLAYLVAPVLAVGKAVREWGGGGFLPFILVDYIAVALLFAGAMLSTGRRAHNLLSAAWGFTAAMAYMSFFGHLQRLGQPDHGAIPHGPLTALIGLLLAVATLGLITSLAADAKETR